MSDSLASIILAVALPVGLIAVVVALHGFLDPDPSNTHLLSAGGIAVYLLSWAASLYALQSRRGD